MPYHAALQRLLDTPSPLAFLLPDEFVAPRYNGLSIANLAPTLVGVFGVPFRSPLPPLAPEVLGGLTEGVTHVLFFVWDAVGWQHLIPQLEAGRLPTLARWLERGARLQPLTSVFPSTTVAATTSLWSGTAPAQHGLLGLNLWLRDLGMMASVLFERPSAAGPELSGILKEWDAPLPKLVGGPSMARQLAPYGVETRAFLLRDFVGSSLSTVHYEGGQVTGIVSATDLAVSAVGALGKRARGGRRAIVGGYWDTVDTLSHLYGPADRRWALEVEALFRAVDEALTLLPPRVAETTLLLVVADHGHCALNPRAAVKLADHPRLRALLSNQLGGDRRATFLHTRQPDTVQAYLAERLPHAFHVLPIEDALAGGLWGPPPLHPDARSRLGDLLLLARGAHSLLWDGDASGSLGHHGGLSPAEMLVPLVAWRLGGV